MISVWPAVLHQVLDSTWWIQLYISSWVPTLFVPEVKFLQRVYFDSLWTVVDNIIFGSYNPFCMKRMTRTTRGVSSRALLSPASEVHSFLRTAQAFDYIHYVEICHFLFERNWKAMPAESYSSFQKTASSQTGLWMNKKASPFCWLFTSKWLWLCQIYLKIPAMFRIYIDLWKR